MKFVTYSATPGLERFPEREQFRIYRLAYKKLMRTNPPFREHIQRFKWRIVGLSAVLAGWSPLVQFLELPPASHLFHVVYTPWYVFHTLRASFRVQTFQNEEVGKVLETINSPEELE